MRSIFIGIEKSKVWLVLLSQGILQKREFNAWRKWPGKICYIFGLIKRIFMHKFSHLLLCSFCCFLKASAHNGKKKRYWKISRGFPHSKSMANCSLCDFFKQRHPTFFRRVKKSIRWVPQSNSVEGLAYPIWLICCAQYPNGLTENPPFCNNCPTLQFYFFASLTTKLILVWKHNQTIVNG